jgi:hypothetical protein
LNGRAAGREILDLVEPAVHRIANGVDVVFRQSIDGGEIGSVEDISNLSSSIGCGPGGIGRAGQLADKGCARDKLQGLGSNERFKKSALEMIIHGFRSRFSRENISIRCQFLRSTLILI